VVLKAKGQLYLLNSQHKFW